MRNSFKKTAFVLTGPACLTAIGLTTFHYQQNKKSSQDVSSETPMNKQLKTDERGSVCVAASLLTG